MAGSRMLICGKASPPVALAAGARTSRAVRSTAAVARVAQRRRLSVAVRVPVLSVHPVGCAAQWGARLPMPSGMGSFATRGVVCAEAKRMEAEAALTSDSAKKEAEASAKKAEKKAKKAEKKAKKMKEIAEMAGMEDTEGEQDCESNGKKGKKGMQATEASGSAVDKTLEAGVVGAMQKVVELQAEGHARQVAAWEQERQAFQEREARLMGLVDSLTQRLVALAAAPSAPSEAAAPRSTPPSSPSLAVPPATDAITQTPPQPAPRPSPSKPAAVLGGDGVYDILNVINAHNEKFSASYGSGNGSSSGDGGVEDGLWRAEEEETKAEKEGAKAKGEAAPEVRGAGREEALRERAEELLAAAAPAEETAHGEMEVVETPPSEQPVVLKLWDDDIYWVNQLQAALLREGLYCGEEEMEEWYFGHHTENALQTWQAMRGLPETGVCDKACWELLLGPGFRRVTAEEMPEAVQESAAAQQATEEAKDDGGEKDVFAFLNAAKQKANEAAASPAAASETNGAPSSDNSSDEEEVVFMKWPLLRLDEGGAAVHHAQVALEGSGFAVDDDEARWWMFGDSTQMAVATFQACNGMADTGMVDEHTWKALLGNQDAVPNDITRLKSFDSYDEDLSGGSVENSRVWLIGEQRWSISSDSEE